MHAESTLSRDAQPPIQPQECESADDAICPHHKGLVRETGDVEGRVFWCPIGRQYWRYRKPRVGSFTSRLNYPKSGVM